MDLPATFQRVRELRDDDRDPDEVVRELQRIRREVVKASSDRDPDPREPENHHLYSVVNGAIDLQTAHLTGGTVLDGLNAAVLVQDYETSLPPSGSEAAEADDG